MEMKKITPLFLVLIFSLSSYAQINFEPGYYIDEDAKRINCLIKNEGWRSNPSKIEIKTDQNASKINVSKQSIKEFGIENKVKYIKAAVDINRSSEKLLELSRNRNPEFKEEDLLLLSLIHI